MTAKGELLIDQAEGKLAHEYTGRQLDAFLEYQFKDDENRFVTMCIDPYNKDLLEKLRIEHAIDATPFVVINKPNGISEALFQDAEDPSQYVHMYTFGGEKDRETLVDMFRSEWKKPPVENGGLTVEVVRLSPMLNINLLRLITYAQSNNN